MIEVNLTREDMAIYQRLPRWLQAPSIVADRQDAWDMARVIWHWRVLGYRSSIEMLRDEVERRSRK